MRWELAPEAVLPSIAVQVVIDGWTHRGWSLQEQFLIRSFSDRRGDVGPSDGRFNDQVIDLNHSQPAKAFSPDFKQLSSWLECLGAQAVVHDDREQLGNP